MKSEMVSVEALVADFSERASTIGREIDENTERLKAAHRQLNRIIADNNASAGPDSTFTFDVATLQLVDPSTTDAGSADATSELQTATLETVDVMNFQQKELFREIMSELRKMNDTHPELNIAEKVAEAGLKLGSGATSGYASGSSSRASSRAPSEVGR